MPRTWVLMVSLAWALAWTQPSVADGALAIGLPPDVAKQGFTYGYANNHPAAEAPALALTQCQISPSAVKDSKLRARCKVVATYHDQCVAVAMDPANGTPGVGWAIQSDLRAAESQALAQCEKTAGPGRRAACKVDHSKCDGSAK
jgi:hypothetical protein